MSSSLKIPMTYEVICGQCSDRLRVESSMESVACPHCGAVLGVPDDDARLADIPTLPTLDGSPADSETAETTPSIETSPVDETTPDDEVAPTIEIAAADESAPDVESPLQFDASTVHAAASDSSPDFSRWGSASSSTNAAVSAFHPVVSPAEEPPASSIPPLELGENAPSPEQDASKAESSPPPAVTATTRPSKRQSTASTSGSVSRGQFLAVLIYASIVTALCLGLLLLRLNSRSHQLESLPDVVPPRDDDGNISHVLAPADAPLPAGHVLALGESQRFGDLLVTPLKVTREPLDFTHRSASESREPAGEVLKLWLRLENVGREHRFAPLDADLLFYRGPSSSGAYTLRANNFLAPAGDHSSEKLIGVYDHPPESEWNLADQHLGKLLAPGEEVVTYVPTETGVTVPDGPLAWRVHLRKGIADNGWGVTTLVEVAFDAKAVSGS